MLISELFEAYCCLEHMPVALLYPLLQQSLKHERAALLATAPWQQVLREPIDA